jgi:hypothetical protein
MLSLLRNLWRRIVPLMGGTTFLYPGPAKAEVVAFPIKKFKATPRPKPQLKMVRSEKRVVNG